MYVVVTVLVGRILCRLSLNSRLPVQEAAFPAGSTIKYRCERGFILEAENGSSMGDVRVLTRTCSAAGTWTGSFD
jgi:hypothetical protein